MLNRLLVGDLHRRGELTSLLSGLRIRLVELEHAAALIRQRTEKRLKADLYGPYIGRAYVETACTALLARLDPFRVLAAKRHQDETTYNSHQRNKSAVQWSSDILSSSKPSADFWSTGMNEPGARALLGAHAEELVWIPAFENFDDATTPTTPLGEWLTDLLKKPPENFCKEIRSGLDGTFSKFSKGVHSELLGERNKMFDLVSLESDFRSVTQRITYLALLSHFSDYFCYALSPSVAISTANKIGEYWK